jgi:hypothetical protein
VFPHVGCESVPYNKLGDFYKKTRRSLLMKLISKRNAWLQTYESAIALLKANNIADKASPLLDKCRQHLQSLENNIFHFVYILNLDESNQDFHLLSEYVKSFKADCEGCMNGVGDRRYLACKCGTEHLKSTGSDDDGEIFYYDCMHCGKQVVYASPYHG